MFRGRYETTVDPKGRTSLPARFRDVLAINEDKKMIVTTALEPCLVAYPYSGWSEFEKKLSARPTFDPAVIQIKRLYVAGAVECPVDGHGRILIPSVLREYASISRDVVWSGMVGYIELWDRVRWQEAFAAAQAEAEGLGKALADLGL
ncbi:MAG: division/cell wall cluster transcriptional repressor MraZ [Proteobacteria bacterium]|nr:division/cell wall cluster transcriptional repressor MraZ [Pseudomonadota bacterium]